MMGGRGRDRDANPQDVSQFLSNLPQREYVHSDHWSWIGELSDSRLENYGHVMARREQEGVLVDQQDSFLRELRKEHIHRTGEFPVWGNTEKAIEINQQLSDRRLVHLNFSVSASAPELPQIPVPAQTSDDVSARVERAAKAVRAASNSRVSRAVQSVRASQDSRSTPQSSAADVDDRARKDARNARDRARRAARRAERERDQ